jgi:putative oxidoreductase
MLSIFRIVVGFLFMQHGLQKMFGMLGGQVPPTGSQIWVGGLIELVGGALFILGLFVRPAAFLMAGTMAVAYFQMHMLPAMRKGEADWFWPVVNKGESAALYCFVFLFFLVAGAGAWSFDAMIAKRRNP